MGEYSRLIQKRRCASYLGAVLGYKCIPELGSWPQSPAELQSWQDPNTKAKISTGFREQIKLDSSASFPASSWVNIGHIS